MSKLALLEIQSKKPTTSKNVTFFSSNQTALKLASLEIQSKKANSFEKRKSSSNKMKVRTILLLTIMISATVCQDETERKQERGVVTIAVGPISGYVIFLIVVGVSFGIWITFCIIVSICCHCLAD